MELLLYWFPIFVGVGFGARAAARPTGTLLGCLCALFWVVLVQMNTGGALWHDAGLGVCTLCGAVAIALMGHGASTGFGLRPGWWKSGSPTAGEAWPRTGAADGRCEQAEPVSEAWTGGASGGRQIALQAMSSAFQQFDAWLEVHRYSDDPWADFDEFLRGIIYQWTGGTHMRIYRVLSEGDELIPLREMEARDSSAMVSARRGIEGFVATTGRSYIGGDPTHGELVDQLAPSGQTDGAGGLDESRGADGAELNDSAGWEPGPAWCFPILRGSRKIGVVTVGRFEGVPAEDASGRPVAGSWEPAQLRLVERVVGQFWNALTEVCRSRAANITDPGSSGLNRKAFFEIGREVLADAYRQGEPVAVAVIAMEGLRALDDAGHWDTVDDIRATVSNVLKQRLRADDRLGRFDDSRFVLLLRRVDSELATLITKELMSRLVGLPAARKPHGEGVELRCGLAGSGITGEGSLLGKPSLEWLVAAAIAACEQARQTSVTMASDLDLTEDARVSAEGGRVE
jgi:GGDEF domain-containing protein